MHTVDCRRVALCLRAQFSPICRDDGRTGLRYLVYEQYLRLPIGRFYR